MLSCACREAADAANTAVKEAALVAEAARADEIAAKQELQDLRQQLTEQLSAASRVTSSQDATIHELYSQLEVGSWPGVQREPHMSFSRARPMVANGKQLQTRCSCHTAAPPV